ncbi:ABC transporter substrate-binding protein [Reyranella aquatilis]|jgi:peptide/nickel transport system substrate-binding protein|uniref:ABC transporter substrate-binding protein n=1 Tax=Reyranella aquatilis TaxID=2035356 RepID=A0ABS8L334_9HYPH|nr:ABC transporter substrate-binding protein [Reyranella aquatilis]MCC8432759.1 ABC transporter substrate-binding protein [Reyranella aquatilis]
MKRRALTTALVLGLIAGPALAADPLPAMKETPMFADQVKSGALPPVEKRIPQQPWVVKEFAGGDGPGQQGGQINTLIASARDTRLMTVYSYTRLIVYDDKFKLKPDILESYEEKDGREFTFRLRAGHKWSDGQPFTTEDFRFFWEDVASNKDLSSGGPNVELLVDGQPPKVEIIDPLTIKYTWEKPNPYFIESQARAAPLFLFRPAHYLKKFHAKYTPEAEILKSSRGGQQSWVAIFRRNDVMYTNDNIDLPTLNPWVGTTPSPAQRFVYVRNPYYHRIDEKGQQLPYVDRIIFTVAATNLVPAKAGLGEADLQPRYLNMRDYTFLQKSAQTSGVNVRLWEAGSGSQLALYPNLTASDPEWRKLMRDVRFRRALSLGIDREELNQVVYIGLSTPSNNTIMPRSELFKQEYADKWAQYDPKLANKLLDEVGLTRKDSQGFRLLPDGRPATIVVEHASEETEDNDALALIADNWKKIGIKMLTKPQTRDNFRLRTASGEAIMTAFAGAVTAAPTPNTSPKEFAPTMLGGLQWSRWGMFVESKGKQGEKCDLDSACKLLDYVKEWESGTTVEDRRKAWHKILASNADEVFSIGTVNGIRQPVVVGPKIRNVPKEGYYAWDPGGYIGLYQPDTFWIAQ